MPPLIIGLAIALGIFSAVSNMRYIIVPWKLQCPANEFRCLVESNMVMGNDTKSWAMKIMTSCNFIKALKPLWMRMIYQSMN